LGNWQTRWVVAPVSLDYCEFKSRSSPQSNKKGKKMQEQIITFERNPEDLKNLASFISQLVIDGIAWYVKEYGNSIGVHITGGY